MTTVEAVEAVQATLPAAHGEWPWWAVPAVILSTGYLGGWVMTHVFKMLVRDALGGRKAPNACSILLGAGLSGLIAYIMANLAGLPPRWCASYGLLVGMTSPLLFPALVMTAAVAAEKFAGRGWGQRVRTTFLGRQRERRLTPRPDNPTPATMTLGYIGPERRTGTTEDNLDDSSTWSRTRAWWNG